MEKGEGAPVKQEERFNPGTIYRSYPRGLVFALIK